MKTKKVCWICQKSICNSNYSRHLNLHSYCTQCRNFVYKNKHRHNTISQSYSASRCTYRLSYIPVLETLPVIEKPPEESKTSILVEEIKTMVEGCFPHINDRTFELFSLYFEIALVINNVETSSEIQKQELLCSTWYFLKHIFKNEIP